MGESPLMRESLCALAMKAARLAGQEALRLWREPHDTRHKGPRDIVTEADLAAEKVIVDTIQAQYPDHSILAEEGGLSPNAGQPAEFQWIIDPIDGTTNYARGLPFFSISVAVAERGRPLAGALYDPLRDRMYHAMRGGGAHCDGRRLSCSRRERLIEALIALDWARDEAVRSRLLRAVLACSPQIGSWRSFGSAALGIALVAEGGADAYLHGSLLPWDLAAAGLLVEEAGGRITGLDGSPAWWRERACLATNGLIHDQLLELFRGVLPAGNAAEDE